MVKMKEGDIVLLAKGDSLFDRLISHITGSSWIHAGLIFGVDENIIKIAEAATEGFSIYHYDRFKFEQMIHERKMLILRPDLPLTNIRTHMLNLRGRPYAFTDLINVLVHIISGKKLFKESVQSLTCSEAVSYFLFLASDEQLDLSVEYDKSFGLITPEDLFRSQQLTEIEW